METQETSTTSGVDASTSGEAGKANEQNQTAPATSGVGVDLVSKLKREKDNYSKRVAELEAQLAKEQEDKLLQKEEFKTLYEREKESRLKLEQSLSERDKRDQEALKRASVREHLLKLGLNPAHEKTAFRLMDTAGVVVDAETRAVIGGEEAAKAFYDQFKDLGLFGKQGVGVSHAAPSAKASGESEVRSLKTQKEFDEYMAQKYGR